MSISLQYSLLLLLLRIQTFRVLCQDESYRDGNLRATLLQSREAQVEDRKYDREKGLDFFMMGWPKTGSTSMMQYLDSSDELKIVTNHKEDSMLTEFCFDEVEGAVGRLFERIEEEYVNSKKDVRYGIKCPESISKGTDPAALLKVLKEHNPNGTETKLLIGLRHPVQWFESFYNYRTKKIVSKPPPSKSLIGSAAHSWRGVYTDRARYEEGIMLLKNFISQPEDKEWIESHDDMGVVDGGKPYKVFIYLMEQFTDHDKDRRGQFLQELSVFMEVEKPFTVGDEVPKRNIDSHKIYDFCEKEHDEVRWELVQNGKKTAEWIRANLAEADGIILPNKEHFLDIVDTFGTDPCLELTS